MKNLSMLGFTEKSNFLGWGVHKKPIYRGDYLKRGALVCRLKMGLNKKEGVVRGGGFY